MMKRKLFIITLGLSIMLLGCGLIYGRVSIGFTNTFETGVVDIALDSYEKKGDEEILRSNKVPVLLPGDVVSLIPRITNDGVDCYVRAKITFRNTDLNDSNLSGISEKWFKADDGYYYYVDVLPEGEQVDIFKEMKIPKDFSQDNEDEDFFLDIAVDAIQSKNFIPAYDTAAPWGNVEIMKCTKDGMYDISALQPSEKQSFQIVYMGDVQKLTSDDEDFFANIPYLMPGDVYSDTVTILNENKTGTHLYFRSEAEDTSDLLDKIKLKITTELGGKTIVYYEGSLRAPELDKDNILGTIPANEEGKFHFEISVPAELNNQYSLLASHVKWFFSTEEIPDNPHTGDDTDLGTIQILFGVCLISLGLFILLLVKERKEEKDKDKSVKG